MEIEDAFSTQAMEQVEPGTDDDEVVRSTIRQIYSVNELGEPDANALNIAALSFMAGRAYQHDQPPDHINVTMSSDVLSEFIDYLVQRGT